MAPHASNMMDSHCVRRTRPDTRERAVKALECVRWTRESLVFPLESNPACERQKLARSLQYENQVSTQWAPTSPKESCHVEQDPPRNTEERDLHVSRSCYRELEPQRRCVWNSHDRTRRYRSASVQIMRGECQLNSRVMAASTVTYSDDAQCHDLSSQD